MVDGKWSRFFFAQAELKLGTRLKVRFMMMMMRWMRTDKVERDRRRMFRKNIEEQK